MEACIPEQDLVELVEGTLAPTRRSAVEAHLCECGPCLELVAELARLVHPEAEPPTEIERAAGLPERYQVTAILGEGGMGRVYVAHDRELSRDVAIKVIRPDRASPELAARLVRESRLMARMQHPAVVTVYDVVYAHEQVFVVMELIRGTTMREWARAARRSWREVLEVLRQVADGLAAAHAAGLVHRDIKPDNILIASADGRVALGDFGVARTRELDPDDTHAMAGTPAYMPPEQMEAGLADERSDVFALAATGWETLFGQRPYPGATIAAIFVAFSSGPPRAPAPGPAGVRDRVPAWLGRALVAALEPARERRTPSAVAFRRAIDVARRDRRRRRTIATLAAVVAVGATALAVSMRAHPEVCGEAGALVEQVWSPARSAELVAGFAALPTAFGRAAGPPLAAEVDRWSQSWRLARTAACTSEPVERTRRERCLDRALGGLTAALDVWRRPDLVLAVEVGKGAVLPSVEACATPPARAAAIPDALAPVVREIDRMVALENAGHHVEAVAIHAAQRDAVARATDPSFLASAGFDDARIAGADGKFDEATAALARAQDAAAQIGDARGVARTLAARASLAIDTAQPERAAALLQSAHAVATLAQIPTDADELFVITGLKLGRADHSIANAPDRALAQLAGLRARGDRRSRWGLTRGLFLIAEAEEGLDTPAGLAMARRLIAEAEEIVRSSLGADHPQTGMVELMLAELDADEGHGDLAMTHYDRALAILTAAYGAMHPVVVKTELNRGLSLAQLDRNDDARAALHAVEPKLIAIEGEAHTDLAMLHSVLAQVEVDTGHAQDALPLLAAAIVTWERVKTEPEQLGKTYERLGLAQVALGHRAESVAAFEHALAAYPPTLTEDRARVQALMQPSRAP